MSILRGLVGLFMAVGLLLLGACGGGADDGADNSASQVVSLQVTPPVVTQAAGLTQPYTAIATYADGRTQDVTDTVAWRSSNTAAVMLYSSGLANTLGAGVASITAVLDGVTSNGATLTVSTATLVSIQVTPPVWQGAVGLGQRYTAIGTFSDRSTADITTSATWQASDAGKVSVDAAGQAAMLADGTATLTAELSGVRSNAASITVTRATLVGLQITPATASQPLGLTQPYSAIGLYSDGRTADVTTTVAWQSSDATRAAISAAGLATTAAAGAAQVTATLEGVTSNTATLTVTPAALLSIAISPATVSKAAGLTQAYTAVGTYTDGTTPDITGAVSWQSADTGKATITPTGLATGVAVGAPTITASLNGIVSSPSTFTVLPASLVSIRITPASASKPKGLTQQYTAVGTYTAGPDQDITASVAWNASDTSKATITAGGLATAVAQGTPAITASLGGVTSNTATLTVTPAALVALAVTPGTASIDTGDVQAFVARGTYSDGSTADVSSTASWSAADTAKLTVSSTGLATGVAAGSTTLTATLDGLTASPATVTVNSRAWTATGSTSGLHTRGMTVLLASGQVLVAGGSGNAGQVATAELYDPATGTWAATGAMGLARQRATATRLADGRVLVAGGQSGFAAQASSELFNPTTGTWAATGAMPDARYSASAVLLPTGQVLVAGGYDLNNISLASAALYDPATGQWQATGALAFARTELQLVLLGNGKVLAIGGTGNGAAVRAVEVYDPATGTWTTSGAMLGEHVGATATLLANGKVLLAGGLAFPFTYLSSAELYDPATGTWSATGSMATAHYLATAVRLPSGKVLVNGGLSSTGLSASAELYDPATGTWATTASMGLQRYEASATLLPSGRVLVCHGTGSTGGLLTCELF